MDRWYSCSTVRTSDELKRLLDTYMPPKYQDKGMDTERETDEHLKEKTQKTIIAGNTVHGIWF